MKKRKSKKRGKKTLRSEIDEKVNLVKRMARIELPLRSSWVIDSKKGYRRKPKHKKGTGLDEE